jgi:transcriptional regulator with XRE-family HTH domain
LSELAHLVEKTPSAVSQFETGRARPDPQTLRRLSLALAMPTEFFMRRRPTAPISIDACHFRSLRSATQRDRRRLLSIATLLCEIVTELDVVNVVRLLEAKGAIVSPIAEDVKRWMRSRSGTRIARWCFSYWTNTRQVVLDSTLHTNSVISSCMSMPRLRRRKSSDRRIDSQARS